MSIGTLIARRHRMIANIDPTHTLTLRNAFIADMTRRYRDLANAITVSVADRDVFGLGTSTRDRIATLAAEPLSGAAFESLTSVEKIREFNVWLIAQERRSVLEFVSGPQGPEPYSNQYIRGSYQKGLVTSTRELKGKGIQVPSTIVPGGGAGSTFLTPFHQNRLQLIYNEVFSKLERSVGAVSFPIFSEQRSTHNTTRSNMNEQIQAIIAQGMAEGIGPEEMARRINNRVEKVGLTNAKRIARTEMVRTYNTAQVFEFQRIEVAIGEEIFVEWFTAEDERVRSSHRARHGKIYPKDEYLSLIGEPNCRCTGLPYLKSVDGDTDITTAEDTRAIEEEQAAKDKAEAAQRRLERQAA